MNNWRELLKKGTEILVSADIDDAEFDAYQLLLTFFDGNSTQYALNSGKTVNEYCYSLTPGYPIPHYLSASLVAKMEKASSELNYERALEIRNMLNDIDITLAKQKISLNSKYNFDVFGAYEKDNFLYDIIVFADI